MPTTLTAVLVLVFVLLPGFVAVETMRGIFSFTGVADREDTNEKLIYKYAGLGIFCNLAMSLSLLAVLDQDIGITRVEDCLNLLKNARVLDLLMHGSALIVFAAGIGVLVPSLYELGLSKFAGRVGWTFATSAKDVFHGHMNSTFRTKTNRWKAKDDPSRLVPWVAFATEGKSRFLGRLRRSNTEIGNTDPIEMVFCPLFHVSQDGTLREIASMDGAQFTGLYGRLEAKNVIYIYKARQDFLPRNGGRLDLPDFF